MRNWLIKLREDLGFTQDEVAIKIGISRQYYGMIESGERNVPVRTAKKIARILGFEWTVFYDGQDAESEVPEYAKRIKALRVKVGYTQKNLSDVLGKTESAIRMWELGLSSPNIDTLQSLAKVFGVSLDYLLGLERAEERKLCWCDRIELSGNMVAYYRNGTLVVKHFPDEYMDLIVRLIEAITKEVG